MNKNNKNSNLNGFAEHDDQQTADAFVETLETDSRLIDSLPDDGKEILRFGETMKWLVDQDLPDANAQIRTSIEERFAAIAVAGEAAAAKPVKAITTKSAWFTAPRFALAACLLLAVGLVALIALLESKSPQSIFSTSWTVAENESTVKKYISPADDVMPVEVEVSGQHDSPEYFESLSLLNESVPKQDLSLGYPPKSQSSWYRSPSPDKNMIASVSPSGVTATNGQINSFGLVPGKQRAFGDYSGQSLGVPHDGVVRFEIPDVEGLQRGGQMDFYFSQQSGEKYAPIHENSFAQVEDQGALSTFSVDVDTASYANIRRFLNNGQRPPVNAIRIEELVNYFNYDYPQPDGEHPFSVNMELASCPWNEKNHLLRVGIKGKEIPRQERSPTNLVFLLDVSGSMQSADKLPLLKQGLTMMIQQLTEDDSVSIVTYAGNAGVVLNPTNGANKPTIEQAIEKLNAGGSTNGSAGINLAYELAQKQFIKNGSNRVILATDGDLNVGITSDDALIKLIKEKASEGVFLTVLGFGTGNLKDSKLEKLADNGNGMYAYVDNNREAHRVLVEQMSGSLETIAKDVKLQIEFNPAEVSSYRLVGYENRILAAGDFDDDQKDAGEIGAGHTVTALYELVLASNSSSGPASETTLKYQNSQENSEPKVNDEKMETKFDGEILTLSLRYKKPDDNQSQKIEFTLKDEPVSFSGASGEFQFAAAVASFGMILRNSKHRGNTSLDWVEAVAARNIGEDSGLRRVEFLDLVQRAKGFAK